MSGAREFHPVANIFALIEGEDFDALVEDVQANGLREDIWLHQDGRIIDGRNRYRACMEAGIEPRFQTFAEPDDKLLDFVISLNIHRRHLTESQRAMIAARVANIAGKGRPEKNAPIGAISQDDAADKLRVGRRSVQRAVIVYADGVPELVAGCEQGIVPVSFGSKLTKTDEPFQRRVVELIREGNKPMEAFRKAKAERIAATDVELPSDKFRVIYADPPWAYGNTQPDYHLEQRDHYPVMSLKDICDMDVEGICEDSAVLFLWVTSPILEESFDVIKAWGFQYKASFVWDKVKHNMGHYNSVRHEFLLICTRGSCMPDTKKLFDSVVTVERTEHSRKPELFYEIIETLYPHGKRVELFAREKREGWHGYGYEV